MNYTAFYDTLLRKIEMEGEVSISTDLETGEKSFGVRDGEFCERLQQKPTVHLCGGGHVSAALAPLLHQLDWPVTVQDDRPDFVTAERFPAAQQCICRPFSEMGEMDFPAGTYFVIMTRGHQDDFLCLSAAASRQFGYIGMIGSRSKVATTFRRMGDLGFDDTVLSRIHTPIGLPIGAQTPMEIAVSIAGQIIENFYKSPCTYMERHIIDGLKRRDKPVVLATVLEKKGSSPRGMGTRMLVFSDESTIGTVGGGAVEYAAIQKAASMCGTEKHQICDYDLSNAKAANLGMICGGHIRILFEPFL